MRKHNDFSLETSDLRIQILFYMYVVGRVIWSKNYLSKCVWFCIHGALSIGRRSPTFHYTNPDIAKWFAIGLYRDILWHFDFYAYEYLHPFACKWYYLCLDVIRTGRNEQRPRVVHKLHHKANQSTFHARLIELQKILSLWKKRYMRVIIKTEGKRQQILII